LLFFDFFLLCHQRASRLLLSLPLPPSLSPSLPPSLPQYLPPFLPPPVGAGSSFARTSRRRSSSRSTRRAQASAACWRRSTKWTPVTRPAAHRPAFKRTRASSPKQPSSEQQLLILNITRLYSYFIRARLLAKAYIEWQVTCFYLKMYGCPVFYKTQDYSDSIKEESIICIIFI
jgi:hypothetical protein